MKNTDSVDSQSSPHPAASQVMGFSPLQWLKSKRISYLTLPLIVMATVTEFVILATGWKYQQVACLPKGMAVTFFHIGPIGATILAVELLKLPLAVWTASRHGWQKGVMLMVGLPLMCLLTFQLVKDMAVYEMGVAMTPASQFLEQASSEEIKITQLSGELAAVEGKKADRDRKLALLVTQIRVPADDWHIKRLGGGEQDRPALAPIAIEKLRAVPGLDDVHDLPPLRRSRASLAHAVVASITPEVMRRHYLGGNRHAHRARLRSG